MHDLIKKIVACEYSFPSDPWDRISEAAKDLIRACLTVNPEERIKPDEMMKHPWLADLSECMKAQQQQLDRNDLVENIDRLVKGRTNSFDKKEVRVRRA